MRAFRTRRSVVDENDSLCFKPFGTMDSHYANLITCDIHVAFYFTLRGPNPIEEPLK